MVWGQGGLSFIKDRESKQGRRQEVKRGFLRGVPGAVPELGFRNWKEKADFPFHPHTGIAQTLGSIQRMERSRADQ